MVFLISFDKVEIGGKLITISSFFYLLYEGPLPHVKQA